jgi:hypothetical protein
MRTLRARIVTLALAGTILGGMGVSLSNRLVTVAENIQKPGHGSLALDIQKPGHGSLT